MTLHLNPSTGQAPKLAQLPPMKFSSSPDFIQGILDKVAAGDEEKPGDPI